MPSPLRASLSSNSSSNDIQTQHHALATNSIEEGRVNDGWGKNKALENRKGAEARLFLKEHAPKEPLLPIIPVPVQPDYWKNEGRIMKKRLSKLMSRHGSQSSPSCNPITASPTTADASTQTEEPIASPATHKNPPTYLESRKRTTNQQLAEWAPLANNYLSLNKELPSKPSTTGRLTREENMKFFEELSDLLKRKGNFPISRSQTMKEKNANNLAYEDELYARFKSETLPALELESRNNQAANGMASIDK